MKKPYSYIVIAALAVAGVICLATAVVLLTHPDPTAAVTTAAETTSTTPLPPTATPPASGQITVITTDTAQTYTTNQTTLGGFLAEAGITLAPEDRLTADGRTVPPAQAGELPLPARLGIARAVSVTIQDGTLQQRWTTAVASVEAALQQAGITLLAGDRVDPPLESPLTAGMTIAIARAVPVTILVDGQTLQVRSAHGRVVDVLAEAGIGLVGYDYTQPALEAALGPGATIQVVRVTETFETRDEMLPYQSIYQPDPTAELDTRALISPGQPGIKRQRVRIISENGVEVGREVDSEWVVQEPVNEVIGYGTNVVVRTLQTPEGPLEYWRVVRMRVTAYTPASAGRAPDDPNYGITASGLKAGKGVVAIDRSVVPWKSTVYVEGYGKGIAGDTGGSIRGRWIDLGYDDGQIKAWSGYADVYYLTPVPAPENINYLIPEALP